MAGLGTINAAVGGLADAGRDAATAAAALGCVPTITLNYGDHELGMLCELEPPARLVLVGGGESVKGPDTRTRVGSLFLYLCSHTRPIEGVFLSTTRRRNCFP